MLTAFALAIALSVMFLLGGGSSEGVAGNPTETDQQEITHARPEEPTQTTAPAVTESVLVVSTPAIGDVVESPMQIVGVSSQPEIGYRLLGGGQLVAEGTLADTGLTITSDGAFTASLDFENTCCIEMTLELFHQMRDGSEGLGLSIPIAYPEPEPTGPEETSGAVVEIAKLFQDAINTKDVTAVAALAPTTPEATLEFLIGGGPYETVDCYKYDGHDECHVVNGIADFVFVVDVESRLITEVTYVGGA